MRFFLRYILSCFVLTVVSLQMAAQDEFSGLDTNNAAVGDTVAQKKPVRVSVLTCTAGDELYSKFGHTALLVQRGGEEEGVVFGVVFNYGCFDYNSDSFVMDFVLGHTDYILEVEPYSRFLNRYSNMGVGVVEQELNLSEEEANMLMEMLEDNMRPSNKMYRYNWLYNNCTEKAREILERAIEGDVVYEREETGITVREMLRKCLENSPWESFGIDMILGEEIDRPTDRRVRMFLPAFYMNEADEALKRNAPLVKSKRQIMQARNIAEKPSFLLSPTFVFISLFVIVCLMSIYEYRKQKNEIYLDVFLHTMQGVAGLLISFLFFFSEHPAVGSNWLVIIFNPIPIFYAIWLVYCKRRKHTNILAYANLAVLAGFLITMMVCRQSFNIAMYFIVFSLLLRALLQSHNAYHKIR